jgi:hypothetical protein
MAKIELHVTADTPEEYHALLAGLVGSVVHKVYHAPVEVDQPDEEEPAVVEAPKRARRTKEQMAADAAPAQTDFQRQIAESAVEPETPAEDIGEYTKADVQAQLQVFISAKSMPAAREIMEQFQAADGQPVKNLTTLQAKDYAAAYAALQV